MNRAPLLALLFVLAFAPVVPAQGLVPAYPPVTLQANVPAAPILTQLKLSRSGTISTVYWDKQPGTNQLQFGFDQVNWSNLAVFVSGNTRFDINLAVSSINPTNLCSLLLYHWTNAAAWPISLPLSTSLITLTNLPAVAQRFQIVAVYTNPYCWLASNLVDLPERCTTNHAIAALQGFYRVKLQ